MPSAEAAAPSPPNVNRRPRILLGITGSVAAVKGPKLALLLAKKVKADVKVILTRTVEKYFWKEDKAVATYDIDSWREFSAATSSNAAVDSDEQYGDWRESEGRISLHYSDEEWTNYTSLQDTVLHIDIRNWADICLIAPLSAHTLAKIANGLCDDLLSCCIRAWDFGQQGPRSLSSSGKPVILAPAMNTGMWYHPLTQKHLDTIRSFSKDDTGVVIVEPGVKTLACGEIGVGALAEFDVIIHAMTDCLTNNVRSAQNREEDVSHTMNCGNFVLTPSSIASASSRKESMKNALLLFAKKRFLEQTSCTCRNTPSTPKLTAPVSPTPYLVIDTFLPLLNLNSNSFLIDLGCGDGRWLIAAYEHAQCRCLGIDVDEKRLMLARESIARNNLQDVIQVRNKDVIEFMKESGEEINNADVIVMYLFREANLEMATLLQQFKERRRYQSHKVVQILSVGFAMPGWTHIYEEKIAGFRVYLYTT